MRVKMNGEFELAGNTGKTGANSHTSCGRKPHAQQAQRTDDDDDGAGDQVGQFAGLQFCPLDQRSGEGGDKGGRESAFGKKIARKIRNAETQQKRIVREAGAELIGHHHFAHQAGEAAQ